MSLLNIILLSLVQGVSEFLPISSSAHLLLASYFFGIEEPSLSLIVALHGGSLVAICVYLWKDIWGLTKGFFGVFKGEVTLEFYSALILIIATIPAVVIGFYVNKMDLSFLKTPLVIGILGIVFGILLGVADLKKITLQEMRHMTIKRGFLIGLGQALALIPGVSRSGMTLTVARFLGLSRVLAAKFSFLMAIPVILGAVVLKSQDTQWTTDILLGGVASFIFSLICLHFMFKFLERNSLLPIVIYRIVLGILLITLL